mmetsp:Transcript_9873/g.21706  ORF Transcript_9873/g.21706 Transcript_9873/m.21706 type:complete len:368 (-) Transcript_9873:65-1168(-)
MWSISLRGLLLALLTVRAVAAASRGTALNGVLLEEDASDASCGLLQIDASAASASKAPRIKREAISSIEDASAAKEPVTLATTNAATNTTATATSATTATTAAASPSATSAPAATSSKKGIFQKPASAMKKSKSRSFWSSLLQAMLTPVDATDGNGTTLSILDSMKPPQNESTSLLVAPSSPSSAEFVTKVRSVDADSTELTDPDPAVEMPDFAKAFPVKNKVVLMFLEMFPIFGPFGIDRFYAGDTTWGVVKLVVSLATCLTGGLIWGYIDAMIVIINALRMQPYIYFLGFKAQFSQDELVPAWWLALFTLIFHFLCFCCCGSDPGRKRFRRAWQAFKKQDPKKEGHHGASGSQQAPAASTLTGQA